MGQKINRKKVEWDKLAKGHNIELEIKTKAGLRSKVINTMGNNV
jgi:hypothetical protein